MLLVFTNIKIKNNRKLLSHNNFSFFGGGGIYALLFKNWTEFQPTSPLQNGGNPAMINQKHLILLSFGESWDTGGERYNHRR